MRSRPHVKEQVHHWVQRQEPSDQRQPGWPAACHHASQAVLLPGRRPDDDNGNRPQLRSRLLPVRQDDRHHPGSDHTVPQSVAIVGKAYRREEGRQAVFRYSWQGQSEVLLSWSPCGRTMDMLNHGYHALMRTYFDQPAVPVVWFRVPDNTPTVDTPTLYGSRNWSDPHYNVGMGEQNYGKICCGKEDVEYFMG